MKIADLAEIPAAQEKKNSQQPPEKKNLSRK
jgi:hypothetical protein